MDRDFSRSNRTVESARGPTVKVPTMGGGLPLESVERPLGTRTIVVPLAITITISTVSTRTSESRTCGMESN